MRPLVVAVAFVMVTTAVAAWIYFLRNIWKSGSRLHAVATKMSLTLVTLVYLFLALEIGFFYGVTISDMFSFTLASKRWEEKHWHPINSFGYRDAEPDPARLADSDLIFVVGDSFIAGHGVADVDDRLSNILGRQLAEKYLVINIAQNGWDTTDEYRAITAFPRKPKKIILSYYINDILGAAERSGFGEPVRVVPPSGTLLRFATDHSYTLNFFYWRLYRFYHRELDEQYRDFLTRAYADPAVWQEHHNEMMRIVNYARENDIDLTVVIFPSLVNVKSSEPITSKVADVFRQNNVPVIDLTPLLMDRDPRTMIVNSLDAHPNEALNRDIATLLMADVRRAEAGTK